MVKRKLNIKKLGVFIGVIIAILVFIIVGISSLIKESKLRKTIEYKLSEVGYTDNEINILKNELNDEEINNLLKRNYSVSISKLVKEDYFIFDNLDKYLDYIKENGSIESNRIVSIVNSNASNGWYNGVVETDVSKDILMLVNKFNGLDETYEPDDLKKVSLSYAYAGKQVREILYDDLIEMLDDAKDSGYKIVVDQGYRSYEDQLEAYNDYANSKGETYADEIAARAGHSEYQTGLSILFTPYNKIIEDVGGNAEHQWLLENAHKYGFILRYPEGKEDITGFSYDPWRFRYVGVDVATKIYNENITFDEYYEFYINK